MPFCILAYPVLVHLAVIFGQPLLAGLALLVLAVAFLYKPLAAGRAGAWLALAAATAGSVLAVRQGLSWYALYLPPILLPAAMLLWWGGSLRAGQVPMVTRIATAIRGGALPPDYGDYTRAVTQLWVAVFALLLAAGLGLALWAPAEIWSLFTNFLNTFFIGLVFLAEYSYRRVRFRHLPHPGFVTFIREVVRVGPRGVKG